MHVLIPVTTLLAFSAGAALLRHGHRCFCRIKKNHANKEIA